MFTPETIDIQLAGISVPTLNSDLINVDFHLSVDFQQERDRQEYDAFMSEWHRVLVSTDERVEEGINLSKRERQWRQLLVQLCQQKSLSAREMSKAWSRTVLGSRYFKSTCLRYPDDVLMALSSFFKVEEVNWRNLANFFGEISPLCCEQVLSQDDLEDSLRRLRRVMLCRQILAEFNGWDDFETRMRAWSALADFCLQTAADWHYLTLAKQWGYPIDGNGLPQPLMVLSLGKLGAQELNLSSDIDLMFVFPEVGKLEARSLKRLGGRERTSAEFFNRVGQGVIKSLDRVTAQGFVFRVDMRLRPYGNSGALVSAFKSVEQYYLTQGREWERFAMIKARISAISDVDVLLKLGVPKLQKSAMSSAWAAHEQHLWEILRPFSYRRYVDYSVIKALRQLKALIQSEVRRKGMDDDIKLGWGGIREIEFIAQVFQLIRGGRDVALQSRALMAILPMLVELGCLPEKEVQELSEAYRFLRLTEHAIQAWEDRQTQTLPQTPEVQRRLAWVMGFAHWDDFFSQLNQYRQAVHDIFRRVIEDDATETTNASVLAEQFWRQITRISGKPSEQRQDADVANTIESFRALFPQEASEPAKQTCDIVWSCLQHRSVQQMPELARERLDRLMVSALSELSRIEWNYKSDESSPDCKSAVNGEHLVTTFERFTAWLEAVAGRSSYFLLLSENPKALLRFLRLLSVSPWIADLLRSHPILLEEVLTENEEILQVPSRVDLSQSLRQQLLRIPEDDEEQQMEALRFFRLSHSLRVATAELMQSLPLMKVSDYLTWLAEAVLEEVLQQTWQKMVDKYGLPPNCSGMGNDKGFVIIGYGKLGGLEMSHQSDLDLVFIYRGERQARTQGAERSLDVPTFYTRLGQKIIHFLTTRTWLGRLYEVDMRLRPSGNSGMLVTRWEAFEQYQRNAAWIWEHQALVRARPVAGCPSLGNAFCELRSEVLGKTRDLADLRQAVIDMRNKMRDHLGSSKSTAVGLQSFHLKHDPGGIVDIEFMVQYAVLAWAAQEPKLLDHTDNIRLLETLDALQRLPDQSARQLIHAYQALRRLGHRLALQQRSLLLSDDFLTAEREQVKTAWRGLLLNEAQ